jgi:hypothetical protein
MKMSERLLNNKRQTDHINSCPLRWLLPLPHDHPGLPIRDFSTRLAPSGPYTRDKSPWGVRSAHADALVHSTVKVIPT